MVKVGETEIEYFIDYLERAIHILDLDFRQSRTLTNSIDPRWQKKLIYQENLLTDILDFDWILYHTDGIISLYKEYNFSFANEAVIKIHEPYKIIMLNRIKARKH